MSQKKSPLPPVGGAMLTIFYFISGVCLYCCSAVGLWISNFPQLLQVYFTSGQEGKIHKVS